MEIKSSLLNDDDFKYVTSFNMQFDKDVYIVNIANWVTPTRVGYKFKGYYNSRDAENQYWHPIQYIDNETSG